MTSRTENICLTFTESKSEVVDIPIGFPGLVRITNKKRGDSAVGTGELTPHEIIFTNQQLMPHGGNNDYYENDNKTLVIAIIDPIDIKLDFSKFQISPNINKITVTFKDFKINATIIAPRELKLAVNHRISKLLITNFEMIPVVNIDSDGDVDLGVECHNVEYRLVDSHFRNGVKAENITIGRIGYFYIQYPKLVVTKKFVVNSKLFKASSCYTFVIGPFVNELILGHDASENTKIPITVRKVRFNAVNWQVYIDPVLIDSYDFDEFNVNVSNQRTIDVFMKTAGRIIKKVKCLKISVFGNAESLQITDKSAMVNGIKPEILEIKNKKKQAIYVDLDPQGTIREFIFDDFTAPQMAGELEDQYSYRVGHYSNDEIDEFSSVSGIENLKTLKVFGNVRILRRGNLVENGVENGGENGVENSSENGDDDEESKSQLAKIIVGGNSPLKTLHLVDNPRIDGFEDSYFLNVEFKAIDSDNGGDYDINVDSVIYDEHLAKILSKADSVVITIRPKCVWITNNEFIQIDGASRHKFVLIDNDEVDKLPIEIAKRVIGAGEKKSAVIEASSAVSEMPADVALLCGSFV